MPGIELGFTNLTRQTYKYSLYDRRHAQVDIKPAANIKATVKSGLALFDNKAISMCISLTAKCLPVTRAEWNGYFYGWTAFWGYASHIDQSAWSIVRSNAENIGRKRAYTHRQLPIPGKRGGKSKSTILHPISEKAWKGPTLGRSRIGLTAPWG